MGYEIVGYEIGGIGDAGLEICVRDIEKKGTFSLQSFIEIVDMFHPLIKKKDRVKNNLQNNKNFIRKIPEIFQQIIRKFLPLS